MLHGIDVSKWQGVINWEKAASKAQFAIIRAGSIDNVTGVCYTDDQFEANVRGAQEWGIPYGFYWFFRPNHSVTKQAEYFRDLVYGHYSPYMMVDLWCDIEVAGAADKVFAFCEYLKKFVSVTGIYTNANTVKYLLTGDTTPLAEFPLWLADWTPPANVPAPWTEYMIWQTGIHKPGSDYGAQSSGIDVNEAVDSLVLPPVVPPPPPVPQEHEHPEIAQLQAETASLRESHKYLADELVKLNQFTDTLTAEVLILKNKVAKLEAGTPPTQQTYFSVTANVANARHAPTSNAAGKPIMVIYPRNSTTGRIQFKAGDRVPAYPGVIDADGSVDYYELVQLAPNGDKLYVRAVDGRME